MRAILAALDGTEATYTTVPARAASLLKFASPARLTCGRRDTVHGQGLLMRERLAQEECLREAKRPLWTAALPGALLMMVLVVFLVPLASFLMSGWAAL